MAKLVPSTEIGIVPHIMAVNTSGNYSLTYGRKVPE
jgi:hypothetical protein